MDTDCCVWGAVVAVVMLGITQFSTVKALPYIVSNVLAMGTCFVLALVVLAFGYIFPGVFASRFLFWMGVISYELYLVHAFTLSVVSNKIVSILAFVAVTVVGACFLHGLMKVSYGRLNSHYSDKK